MFLTSICLPDLSLSVPCSPSIYITVPLSFDEMRRAVSFPFLGSFCRTVFWCHHSFALLTLLRFFQSCHSTPCPPNSSNSCPVTILLILSTIYLISPTSPNNLATGICPLHIDTRVPLSSLSRSWDTRAVKLLPCFDKATYMLNLDIRTRSASFYPAVLSF